jgi:hypothetical protein
MNSALDSVVKAIFFCQTPQCKKIRQAFVAKTKVSAQASQEEVDEDHRATTSPQTDATIPRVATNASRVPAVIPKMVKDLPRLPSPQLDLISTLDPQRAKLISFEHELVKSLFMSLLVFYTSSF